MQFCKGSFNFYKSQTQEDRAFTKQRIYFVWTVSWFYLGTNKFLLLFTIFPLRSLENGANFQNSKFSVGYVQINIFMATISLQNWRRVTASSRRGWDTAPLKWGVNHRKISFQGKIVIISQQSLKVLCESLIATFSQ